MFTDWLRSLRNTRAAAPSVAPDPVTVKALADSVQQLCTVCEELLGVAAERDLPTPLVRTIPEQLEAIRACAGEIKYGDAVRRSTDTDAYSLAALGRWAWRD